MSDAPKDQGRIKPKIEPRRLIDKENTEGWIPAARTSGVDFKETCGRKYLQHRVNGLGGSMLWPWSEVVSGQRL